MANNVDPQGISQERARLISRLTALGTAISNYVGDQNGRADLVAQQQYIQDRLNLSSTSVTGTAFAFSGFGIEKIST